MAEKELIVALERQGAERARACWEEAEQLVTTRQRAIEDELARLQEETDQELKRRSEALRSSLLFEAQSKARECQLYAEAELDKRLQALAKEIVTQLAATAGEPMWEQLCEELPACDWQSVTICAEDRERAQRKFPSAKITVEQALGGGLILATADGQLQIDNSLHCRLQRAWPDLLPKIMVDLRALVEEL